MATVTYTCDLSSQKYWGNQGAVSLSGPSSNIPDGSIVTNVALAVYCGVSEYNQDVEISFTLIDSSYNSIYIEDWCNTGNSNRITVTSSGTPDQQIDWNNLSTIDVDGNTVLTLRDSTATLTLTYVVPGYCEPPTTVTINNSSYDITINDSTATLAWSGAKGGTNNSIAGYVVLYSDSTNGSTWGDWHSYGETDVSSTSSSGSLTVNSPSAGAYRKFSVSTFGSAGKDYMSEYTESPVVYRSPSLPVIFNGTQLTKIIYNGTTISSLVYNGTKLF